MDDSDSRLMQRYRDGDMAAFERLYARHRGPLYRYLLHQCRPRDAAADVFQEVWSRIVAGRDRYEVRAEFRTWLFHIAHHCVADHYRTRARKRIGQMDPVDDHAERLVAAAADEPEAAAGREERNRSLQAALAELPHEQRDVFLLSEEGGLALRDIAQVTGVPVETVKSRLRYAIAKLRRALADPPGMPALAPARMPS